MRFNSAPFSALLVAAYAQALLVINTPASAVQCEPVLLTWNGANPPFFVDVIPGGQFGAPAIIDFGEQNGTSLTWVVNVAAGTSVSINVRDSIEETAFTAPFTIEESDDSSCLSA